VECICVILIGVNAQIVIVCEVLRMAFVFFHHSNLSFSGEKWLSYIIITPYLHRAHHSTVREEHDSNYGIVLSVWDLMFETRKELVPNTVGLEMIEANDFVQLFCLAFVTERRFARLLHILPRRRRRGLSRECRSSVTRSCLAEKRGIFVLVANAIAEDNSAMNTLAPGQTPNPAGSVC
jgi:hypothetical protein